MAPLTAPSRADVAERGTLLADTAAARHAPWRRLSSPGIIPAYAYAGKVEVADSWSQVDQLRPVWIVRDGRDGLEAAWSATLAASTFTPARSGPVSGTVRASMIDDWLAEDRMPLFVLRDRQTARRLVELFDRRGLGDVNNAARTCAAQIRLALGLASSARVVVLEDAVDRVLWRPSKVRPGNVASWAAAYGLADDWAGLAGLVRVVAGGPISMSREQRRYAKALAAAETRAVRSTDYRGGAVSAATAFTAAQAAGAAWEAYMSCDAAYAPMAAATGESPIVRALRPESGTRVAAQLSTPCRLRVGRTVRIFHPDGSGEATLERLAYTDEDGLIGVFSSSARAGSKSRGFVWLERQAGQFGAREVGRVCPVPYLPNTSGSRFSPWLLGGDKVARVERDVPLDVSLAVGD